MNTTARSPILDGGLLVSAACSTSSSVASTSLRRSTSLHTSSSRNASAASTGRRSARDALRKSAIDTGAGAPWQSVRQRADGGESGQPLPPFWLVLAYPVAHGVAVRHIECAGGEHTELIVGAELESGEQLVGERVPRRQASGKVLGEGFSGVIADGVGIAPRGARPPVGGAQPHGFPSERVRAALAAGSLTVVADAQQAGAVERHGGRVAVWWLWLIWATPGSRRSNRSRRRIHTDKPARSSCGTQTSWLVKYGEPL